MPNDTAKALAAFLENAAPVEMVTVETVPVATPAEETPAVVVETEQKISVPSAEDMMKEIVADLKRIRMVAKNLHYRAKGKPFYGLHLLAELIWDVDKEADDLIEVYFMGELQVEPPLMEDLCNRATNMMVLFPRNKDYYIGGLKNICHKTMRDIETVKRTYPELCAGTNAVLDTISQKCLVAIGLLTKTEE